MTLNDYFDIDIKETKNKEFIQHLADVAGTEPSAIDNMSDEDILTYAKIEMGAFPNKISISCGMTRQKQQYMPNSYHASMELDVSLAKEAVIAAITTAPKGTKLAAYKKLKTFLYNSIFSRYNAHETLVRHNMALRAQDDGVALPGDV